jgi:hypothetical protein
MHSAILDGIPRYLIPADTFVRTGRNLIILLLPATFSLMVLVAAPLAADASSIAAKSDNVPVVLRLFDCQQDAGFVPTIYVDSTESNAKPGPAVGGPFVFNLSIEPGLHRFYLTTPTCATRFDTVVLEEHPRDISARLILRRLLGDDHTSCALAGVLPFGGITVSLVQPKGSHFNDLQVPLYNLTAPEDRSYPADVDHGAYYVGDFFPGDYDLDVGMVGGSVAIPIHLSTAKGPGCQAFERDITIQDLERPLTP